jgi:hypothetical protein
MAQVPISQGRRVALQPLPAEKLRAADFGSGGEAIGQAATRFGQQVADFAEYKEKVQSLEDQAVVKEATNNLNQHYAEVGYTGADPYYAKQGKAAILARPQVEQGLDTLIDTTRGGLQNERQRKMFDNAVKPQRIEWGTQLAQHSERETVAYEADESTSRVGMATEMARLTYLDDPAHGEKQLETALGEIENLGRLKGWGADKIATEKLKTASGTYKDIGTRLAYEGGAKGPDLARAFVKQHEGSMIGDDRETVLTHARTQQNANEAEQRRIEADAHRQQREAMADAKDRANSVYRNIQDGVAVDPKALASAIGDARLAGDDALVEGLRQGGLKNNLTQEYASATPGELASRVNELSAEITKAGGKVDPDKIVERDHLQTLLTKSRTEIHSDPLAWGAEHLGISIPPLDLRKPDSIMARVSAATTIARRTGTTPRPLTQDEVAAFQQRITSGTTEQKVDLALKLARFGPLALPAAEQLTNNSGFINLIGLATHGNHGVAAARVNQIVTGYDVLKTKPKLVNKDQAQQQFNEYVGGAFEFLPQVSSGLFSNAQALLAAQANEHGWAEWNDVDSRAWYRSVNSALGAYTRDGKQVGGLASFNGAVTVLPENMSQDEFEGAIAKAHGPEFRRAQNGDPVSADGRMPTATDLKRMQWIPSGDGVYRLSDGNGFLKTKAGGFYEIDVGKLNPVGGGPRLPFGMIKQGNIDIHHRPVVHNSDGSISTVRTISIGADGGEVLIPTVVGGKVVSNEQAVAHYKRTGEHLGVFKDAKAATAFAKRLHEEQAQEYGDPAFNAKLGTRARPLSFPPPSSRSTKPDSSRTSVPDFARRWPGLTRPASAMRFTKRTSTTRSCVTSRRRASRGRTHSRICAASGRWLSALSAILTSASRGKTCSTRITTRSPAFTPAAIEPRSARYGARSSGSGSASPTS